MLDRSTSTVDIFNDTPVMDIDAGVSVGVGVGGCVTVGVGVGLGVGVGVGGVINVSVGVGVGVGICDEENLTSTGVFLLMFVPSPSWPSLLYPHMYKVFPLSARE